MRLGSMKMEHYRVDTLAARVRILIRIAADAGRNDPRVRRIAASIVARKCVDKHGDPIWCVPEKEWRAEIVEIFNFVKRNVRYVRDTDGRDLFQHPLRTLQLRAGDCDDCSSLLASLLIAAGYEVRYRIMRTRDASSWNHVFVLARVPARRGVQSQWISLDASTGMPAGWHPPKEIVAEVRDFPV